MTVSESERTHAHIGSPRPLGHGVGYRSDAALSPRSPVGFVGTVTTPVGPESHPPNRSIGSLLVDWVADPHLRSHPVLALGRSVCSCGTSFERSS